MTSFGLINSPGSFSLFHGRRLALGILDVRPLLVSGKESRPGDGSFLHIMHIQICTLSNNDKPFDYPSIIL